VFNSTQAGKHLPEYEEYKYPEDRRHLLDQSLQL